MNYKKIETAVFALLEKASFRPNWTNPPSVSHIPFMRSRAHFFLLVNICVKPDWVDREKQIKECLEIIQMIIGADILTNQKSVEVAAYAIKENTARRVFRMFVNDTMFSQAIAMNVNDLLDKKLDGIACQWPKYRPRHELK
jgi:hypothetical protein